MAYKNIHKPNGPYEAYFKRPLDFILSFTAFLAFSWLYIIVACLVRIKLGSPILFKQPRPGLNCEIFNIYKFRTMTDERDNDGNLLPDEVRLTPFGRWLRSTSLDEIPELFNIILGDMSLIGPRPLLVEYLPWYTEEENHRHDVRPGLSGWAQVNGRNITVWDERLQQDLFYVNNCGFLFDCKIIWMTVMKTAKRQDIIVGKQHGKGHGRLDVVRKELLESEKES